MSESVHEQPSREGVAAAGDLPPEVFLRRDHPLRFERGGIVYAADGRVGVLRQVVVDQDAGQVAELVVALDPTGDVVVLPVSLVAKTGGNAIVLTIRQAKFTELAREAPRYERRTFRKANLRALCKNGKEAAARSRRLAVLEANQDLVMTPAGARLGSDA